MGGRGRGALTAGRAAWFFMRMAPPLLPSTRLSQCPACSEHVKRGEDACPHCGARLADTRASGAAAVLIGLALTGCPDKGPDTTSASAGESETTAIGESTLAGTGSGESGGESTVATTEPIPPSESDYGVPTSDSFTGTMTEGTSGTGETSATDPSTTTTGAESDYGVAAL